MKFICKDLWMIVFKKQIDNLKTNHRVSTKTHASIPSLTGTGCLCFNRQHVPSFFENEHGQQGRSCSEGATAPILPLWHHSRRIIKLGNQGDSTSRNHRVANSDISDQNNSTKELRNKTFLFGLNGQIYSCLEEWQSPLEKMLIDGRSTAGIAKA